MDLKNLELAVGFWFEKEKKRGIIISLNNKIREVKGIEIGILQNNNVSAHGILAGMMNECYEFRGLQIGGLNVAEYKFGDQIGITNVAERGTGSQIGITNTILTGNIWQAGVMNLSGEGSMQFSALLNMSNSGNGAMQLGPINIIVKNPWYMKVLPLANYGVDMEKYRARRQINLEKEVQKLRQEKDNKGLVHARF